MAIGQTYVMRTALIGSAPVVTDLPARDLRMPGDGETGERLGAGPPGEWRLGIEPPAEKRSAGRAERAPFRVGAMPAAMPTQTTTFSATEPSGDRAASAAALENSSPLDHRQQ